LPENLDGEVDVTKFIALSGTFQTISVSDVRMIQDASAYGEVIIILRGKEKYEERREILMSIKGVRTVMEAMDVDGTVNKNLEMLSGVISYYGRPGGKGPENTPEASICAKYKIPIIYGLGGCSEK